MQAVQLVSRAAILSLLLVWLGGCAAAGAPEDIESDGFGGAGAPIPGGTTIPGGGSAGTAAAPTTPSPPGSMVIPGGSPTSPTPGATAGSGGTPGAVAGAGGLAGIGGIAGMGVIDMGGLAGTGGVGAGGAGGTPATAGAGGGMVITGGACCADGNCLCHGPDPTALTSADGPFNVDTFEMPSGRVYYPTDAEPPFAAVAVCGGFLNTGAEMVGWGDFYASHGIVTVITWTIGSDIPDIRAIKLVASLDELKTEAAKSGNPLNGKLTDRMGTSGYSMGGGGTTIAATSRATLRTSVGLAAWGPVGSGVQVPTLFLCGASDTVAPCFGSQSAYDAMPATTPKMLLEIPGTTHFNWFGPQDAGRGTSGETALAFQKVYLEGDERWLPILKGVGGSVQSNLK